MTTTDDASISSIGAVRPDLAVKRALCCVCFDAVAVIGGRCEDCALVVAPREGRMVPVPRQLGAVPPDNMLDAGAVNVLDLRVG